MLHCVELNCLNKVQTPAGCSLLLVCKVQTEYRSIAQFDLKKHHPDPTLDLSFQSSVSLPH